MDLETYNRIELRISVGGYHFTRRKGVALFFLESDSKELVAEFLLFSPPKRPKDLLSANTFMDRMFLSRFWQVLASCVLNIERKLETIRIFSRIKAYHLNANRSLDSRSCSGCAATLHDGPWPRRWFQGISWSRRNRQGTGTREGFFNPEDESMDM